MIESDPEVMEPTVNVEVVNDMDLMEVDRLIEDQGKAVSNLSVEEWKKRSQFFEATTKNLRGKVGGLKSANEGLARAVDSKDKLLREYKAYSAQEVVDGIKPNLAPLKSILNGVSEIPSILKEMEARLQREMIANIHEVYEEVVASRETCK